MHWHTASQIQIIQNSIVSLAVMREFVMFTDPQNFSFPADGVTVESGFNELKYRSWKGISSGP